MDFEWAFKKLIMAHYGLLTLFLGLLIMLDIKEKFWPISNISWAC